MSIPHPSMCDSLPVLQNMTLLQFLHQLLVLVRGSRHRLLLLRGRGEVRGRGGQLGLEIGERTL